MIPSKSITASTIATDLLVFYQNLIYYTCLVPFRFVYKDSSKSWHIHTNKFQSTVCYILVLIPFIIHELAFVPEFWHNFTGASSVTPKSYFILATSFLHTFKLSNFLWTIFKNKCKILQLLNSVHTMQKVWKFSNASKHFHCYLIIYFRIFTIINIFGNMTLAFSVIDLESAAVESPNTIFKRILQSNAAQNSTSYTPQLPQYTQNIALVNELSISNFSTGAVCLALVEMWLRFGMFVFGTIIELFYLGPCVFILYIAVQSFRDFYCDLDIKQGQQFSFCPLAVQSKFEEIKRLSSDFNEIWALPFFIWVVEAFFRLIFFMNSMISSKNPVSALVMAGLLISTGIALWIAAETFRMVNTQPSVE